MFSATNPDASGFSVAEPRAFGFFDADPGAILVDGSTLEVGEGETLSLVGGDITVDGGEIGAEAGTINLVSAATADGLSILANRQVLTNGNSGDIALLNGAVVTTTGNNGGDINIVANDLRLSESLIAGDVRGDGAGGNLSISAENIEIYDSIVSKSTFGNGDAGEISVLAGNLRLEGTQPGVGARILSSSFPDPNSEILSSGSAGNIVINAESIDLINGGRISSTTSSGGDAGDIQINANKLVANRALDFGVTGVFSDASVDISRETRATGNAGSVTVNAGEIELVQGGQIRSLSFSDGDAGNISVVANRLHIDGKGSPTETGITSDAASDSEFALVSNGNAGDIFVDAVVIEIFDGGRIDSDTNGIGDAGSINVVAKNISIKRGDSTKPTGISSDSGVSDDGIFLATGNAGRINIIVDNLNIEDGGEIRSVTFGSGDAGDINIEARSIKIDGQNSNFPTIISSRGDREVRFDTQPSGDAGSIVIRSESVNVLNGATIDSLNSGSGNAGSVFVSSSNINIDSEGQIVSTARGSGDGGSVTLEGRHLMLSDGAIVSASTRSGEAGKVDLRFDHIRSRDITVIASLARGNRPAGGVSIRAEKVDLNRIIILSRSVGDRGGQIAITGQDYLILSDVRINANGAVPEADTSLINLEGNLVALNNSSIVALTGDGTPITGSGVVNVGGDFTLISTDSTVDASSSVAISGLLTDFSNQLLALDSEFADASRLIRDSCESGGDVGGSTFASSGQPPTVSPGEGLLPGQMNKGNAAPVALPCP